MVAIPKHAIIQTAYETSGLRGRDVLRICTCPYSQARKELLIVDSPCQVFLSCSFGIFGNKRLEKAYIERESR